MLSVIFSHFFRDFSEIILKSTLPNANNTLTLIFCDFVLADAIPCFTYFLFIFSGTFLKALPNANNTLTLIFVILYSQTLYHASRIFYSFFRKFFQKLFQTLIICSLFIYARILYKYVQFIHQCISHFLMGCKIKTYFKRSLINTFSF